MFPLFPWAMEATGGYEKQAIAWLWAQGLPVALLNPRAVRRFAGSMGLLEKTDRLDAGVIAWFAAVKRIAAGAPPSAQQQRLKALVTRLRQLTVLAYFREILALVAAQIRALEKEIAALLAADPLWHRLDQTFRSIKGVADRTVARLMADAGARCRLQQSRFQTGVWHPWPTIAGNTKARVRCAADGVTSAPSCSWWRDWCAVMMPTSLLFTNASPPPENPKKSFASPSLINSWSASTPKPAMYAPSSHPSPVDNPDSRSR